MLIEQSPAFCCPYMSSDTDDIGNGKFVSRINQRGDGVEEE